MYRESKEFFTVDCAMYIGRIRLDISPGWNASFSRSFYFIYTPLFSQRV